MYKVLVSFIDDIDGGTYYEGETYPHEGIFPSESRVNYLSGSKNKAGKPVIKTAVRTKKKAETE